MLDLFSSALRIVRRVQVTPSELPELLERVASFEGLWQLAYAEVSSVCGASQVEDCGKGLGII